ncbi:pilin glycosylation protein [Neisseria gonorrhoeae]|uniref:Pilin glycosylation protein n=1 Tax=Neisseria gonorrhoeae TaxID=485 RepID=A0A378W1Z2_NEIGO|nr:pilin glycosylation protein [Neisseria gonorrhoeae]
MPSEPDGPNTMLNTALSPWPSFTREEADAVSKVLLSNKVNYWTGSECREFEKNLPPLPARGTPSPFPTARLRSMPHSKQSA